MNLCHKLSSADILSISKHLSKLVLKHESSKVTDLVKRSFWERKRKKKKLFHTSEMCLK